MATALLWAFVILSTQKDAQYQIVEEIASFASEHQRLPTFADRDALPFLVSVQKECMRFRPITPFGEFHETEQDGKSLTMNIHHELIIHVYVKSRMERTCASEGYHHCYKFVPHAC